MNLKDIEKEVEKIKSIKADAEMAHGLEDCLRDAFIKHVADTAGGELAKMAKAVLKINDPG